MVDRGGVHVEGSFGHAVALGDGAVDAVGGGLGLAGQVGSPIGPSRRSIFASDT